MAHQDEHDEAKEEDDQDNGVDDGEPVNLNLFREEGLKELLTIAILYPEGGEGWERR